MRPFRSAALLLTICLAGACVPRRPAPPPVVTPPPPAPVQTPRPAPPPPALNLAWTDAPLSPGNWSYRPGAQGSSAEFGPAGTPSFVVRCFGNGQVLLSRAGASAAGTLTFRASNLARTVNAAMQPVGTTATLPATDSLLDALIFSRGRFAVETPGQPTLIVPTWPELARVVQDCRR